MEFTVSNEINSMTSYVNDGEFYRFVGWTGKDFILGIQSGIKGDEANYVRFDETLDVDIYIVENGIASRCPNLDKMWT